jgi:hypothetical protein
MFGIIRPCRHRLPADLQAAWLGHLCGLCLALRDEHGHGARLTTNYDLYCFRMFCFPAGKTCWCGGKDCGDCGLECCCACCSGS